jgi:hypothetical protein
MAKAAPPHPAGAARKCLFCDSTNLSKTHIWPNWLNKLLLPGPSRLQEREDILHSIGDKPKVTQRNKLKQGSIFTQKPYLACVDCNGGWMKTFEDEMLKFSRPLFASTKATYLTNDQVKWLYGWLTLITILAEYIDISRNCITISPRDREYFKKYLNPPNHWTIIAASSDSQKWNARYRHSPLFIGKFTSMAEYRAAVREGRPVNTQISSFGMGRLFVQVFSSPDEELINGFRISAKKSGFVQLWPRKSKLLFFKEGVKFPTELVLNNSEADEVADAFKKEIEARTVTPEKA